MLLFAGIESYSQENVVKKSKNAVVIGGKSYYIHNVEKGETLYAIARAYGLSVEEIKAANDKKDERLALYEALKIPIKDETAEEEGGFFKYRVLPKETFFSISQKFGLTVKELLRLNPEYSKKSILKAGTYLRLPFKSEEQPKMQEEKHHRFEQGNNGERPDAVGRNVDVFEEIRFDDGAKDREIKVALLLPLYSNSVKLTTDVEVKSREISKSSEQFIYFYEGMLLAVDSLKEMGYKIELHVFDTRKEQINLLDITRRLNRWRPDLIIGPVYETSFDVVAGNLRDRNTPMIYPLSQKAEFIGIYPNMIKVSPAGEFVYEEMIAWSRKHNISGKNTLCIFDSKTPLEKFKYAFAAESKFLSVREANMGVIAKNLREGEENIVILPISNESELSPILASLEILSTKFTMKVAGLGEWLSFSSIDPDVYYKINTVLFAYNYHEACHAEAAAFKSKYRLTYAMQPTSIASKAYDIGFYFMKLIADYSRKDFYEAIEKDRNMFFSKFKFRKIRENSGYENTGCWMLNFKPDYSLEMQ